MAILGYIGYTILLFFAVTWTIGVRTKLDAGVGTIFGALFFVLAAVFVAIFEVDKLHSLWLIAGGFALTLLLSYLAAYAKPLFRPFQFMASLFAMVVRVGIPAEKIRAAQEIGLKASLQEWTAKQNDRN